ncbi:AfsR/SARP family transcriptional regulator [Streptomyces sp. MUM 178J]|uniref:AfsR/SARP family transcriptional regulator n=1 Tax=Streptomyces sp. MUM 178J TaxID=2791991 RepID=UPI001F038622|nr:BTAD domain-containing putative transcriptional regulator [Streptomyces sp. MUM 178J]WRQ80807.1 BTAD domain-containing putative transcriptional regulator [Streptomyces sp. MUM 178J]
MGGSIEFSVLGAVRVRRDGAPVAVGSPQQQALLVALALRPDRVIATHELIASVWGEEPPGSALASLRTYVWRLRNALEEQAASPALLLSQRDGYRLAISPLAVDVHRAERLAADAARASGEGDDDACGRLLNEAVALWQGAPLAGVPGPFAEQYRVRCEELRLSLLEDLFECDLRAGRYAALIPSLTVYTHEQPLRERPYGFLMRALVARGRQADALAVYGRARSVLAAELGIDPGPELAALHQRVLGGDPLLSLPVREETASGRTSTAPSPAPAPLREDPDPLPADDPAPAVARPAQLPADTSDFIGRTSQVEDLCKVLTDPARTSLPVALVSGMGGIGKTTLALRVAHQVKESFPGGQLHVDLRGSGMDPAAPTTVLGSLLCALGVAAHALPPVAEDRARLFRTMLDGRRMLLFLDDARDAAQVRPLLPGSADCGVIVTSRTRAVGISTPAAVALDAFGTEEAKGLLAAIVGAARVEAEEDAAVELVSACGHLPLAVRIVASRLAARPHWQIATMTRRLVGERCRIGELRAGDMAMATVFEVGYQQLPEDQARAFRLLAPVGRLGIGLEAAAAALGLDEYTAEDLLESLVDAAMLEAPQPGRYRYHDLVRAFALQLPPPPGERNPETAVAALAPLLDHLLARARAAFQCVAPGDADEVFLPGGSACAPAFADLVQARAWVTAEFDCLISAVALAAQSPARGSAHLLRVAADLVIAVTPFGKDIPYAELAAAAAGLADAAARAGDDRAAGRGLFVCGNAALQSARLEAAAVLTRRAAEACERAGDLVIFRQTLNDRGLIAQFLHRYEEAVSCYDQSVDLARRLGQLSGELVSSLNAAQAGLRTGRAEEALLACDTALDALRGVADQHCVAYALYVRAMALHELGRHAEALSAHTQCVDLCETWQIRGQEAQARFRLAETLRVMGRCDEAVREAGRALELSERRGAERDQGLSLLVLGWALADLGEDEAAVARARQAYAVFTRLGLPDADDASRLIASVGAMA